MTALGTLTVMAYLSEPYTAYDLAIVTCFYVGVVVFQLFVRSRFGLRRNEDN